MHPNAGNAIIVLSVQLIVLLSWAAISLHRRYGPRLDTWERGFYSQTLGLFLLIFIILNIITIIRTIQ